MAISRPLAVAGWVALLGSSLGDLAQWAVTPVPAAQGTAADQIAGVAGHATAMRVATWLDLPILLIIPAALFIGWLAGAPRSRLAAAGAAVVFTATLGAGYLLALDPLVSAAASTGDRAAGAAVLTAYEGSGAVAAVTVVALVGEAVGFVLLGIALLRAGTIPRWAAVALMLATPLEVGGEAAGVWAVSAVGDGLRVLAFVLCALALGRVVGSPAAGSVTARPTGRDSEPAAVLS